MDRRSAGRLFITALALAILCAQGHAAPRLRTPPDADGTGPIDPETWSRYRTAEVEDPEVAEDEAEEEVASEPSEPQEETEQGEEEESETEPSEPQEETEQGEEEESETEPAAPQTGVPARPFLRPIFRPARPEDGAPDGTDDKPLNKPAESPEHGARPSRDGIFEPGKRPVRPVGPILLPRADTEPAEQP